MRVPLRKVAISAALTDEPAMRVVRIVNFGITVKIRYNSLSMVRIKICGTTNLDDALAAVEAGAEARGFVFFRGSPPAGSPETAPAIIAPPPGSGTSIRGFGRRERTIV